MANDYIKDACKACGGVVFTLDGEPVLLCERDTAWRPSLYSQFLAADDHEADFVVAIDAARDQFTLSSGAVISGADIQKLAAEALK